MNYYSLGIPTVPAVQFQGSCEQDSGAVSRQVRLSITLFIPRHPLTLENKALTSLREHLGKTGARWCKRFRAFFVERNTNKACA